MDQPTQFPAPSPQTNPYGNQPNRANILTKIRKIASTLLLLLAAPLLALFLTLFVFQTYQVEGPSMENALHNNDRLIVLKLPVSWSKLTRSKYIPKRGEIIIFNQRSDSFFNSGGNTRQLIKRVIALPGERIVIDQGTVTVYNNKHVSGYQPDKLAPYGQNIAKTNGNVDLTVEEGEIYVLGDNRENSQDSRVFGPVKAEDIVGELALRIYPLNQVNKF